MTSWCVAPRFSGWGLVGFLVTWGSSCKASAQKMCLQGTGAFFFSFFIAFLGPANWIWNSVPCNSDLNSSHGVCRLLTPALVVSFPVSVKLLPETFFALGAPFFAFHDKPIQQLWPAVWPVPILDCVWPPSSSLFSSFFFATFFLTSQWRWNITIPHITVLLSLVSFLESRLFLASDHGNPVSVPFFTILRNDACMPFSWLWCGTLESDLNNMTFKACKSKRFATDQSFGSHSTCSAHHQSNQSQKLRNPCLGFASSMLCLAVSPGPTRVLFFRAVWNMPNQQFLRSPIELKVISITTASTAVRLFEHKSTLRSHRWTEENFLWALESVWNVEFFLFRHMKPYVSNLSGWKMLKGWS